MTNKYLNKIAAQTFLMKPIIKPWKSTTSISSLKIPGKRDTVSSLASVKRSVESTPRMKSLREILDDNATMSYKGSKARGNGNAASTAVKRMQRDAADPLSSARTTYKRVR